MQNSLVYLKSTRDEAHFPFIFSIDIPCSTSYRTSGFTSLRKLQRLPETPVSSLYEYSCQYSNSRKAPCNPYRPEKRADSENSIKEVDHLSTSTSRRAFPQLSVCERDPEFAASHAVDTEIPCLQRKSDFPAVASMQALISSPKIKGCLILLCSP